MVRRLGRGYDPDYDLQRFDCRALNWCGRILDQGCRFSLMCRLARLGPLSFALLRRPVFPQFGTI